MKRILEWTTDYFESKGCDTPRLDSEVLLGYCLNLSRVQLYLNYERPLSTAERDTYRELVLRRASREPVSLIVGNKEFWTYEFQKGRTQEEYQTAYYAALLQMVHCFKDYNVLGLLDMIKRYDKCGDYPDEKIMNLVDPILRQVIADGKGIELNTSSFKYKLKDTMPSRSILQLYHDLGGHILTIGSDTHETQHLADHFTEVRHLLREIGFKEFCTFEQRQPVFHSL